MFFFNYDEKDLQSKESYSQMYHELQHHLLFNDSLPFLFVGSGFSRRYLGTPDWTGLLKHFCNEINPEDPFLYSKYESRAKARILEDHLDRNSTNVMNSTIADFIEQDYDLMWYSDPRFEDERNRLQSEILNGKVTPRIDTAIKLIRGLGYEIGRAHV